MTGCDWRSLKRRARTRLRRLELQDGAIVFIREQVEKAVGTLANVSNPLPQLDQQRLAPDLLPFVIEDDSMQLTCAANASELQPPGEQVVLPVREAIARIERHARYRD